ncbi:uncharacterized protein LOC121246379 [Juglans microcarpa x Juglans regia]|uniref:uncharacterized protein LOC121246379 n=1 Tax=Juglans microcarpa x Juglans regia TaxID=2249226 RepID=UPI001B7F4B60|nr:uncharacterized protein LOC121246379 [Juglans microcarpa x Juglans regia]
MSNSRNQDKIQGLEHANQYGDEDSEDSSMDALSSCGVESGASSSGSRENGGSRTETGLTDRLTDVLVYGGDGDLLLQQSDREDRVLQWLRALDMQVIGACRADERLKPLLKMNASNGLAEDCLLAHLSRHFEPAEVGMLARCFCIPLVSLRVGKICKQGTVLFPTATRGNLNLTVLPTSDLRLSFIGDNGETERLFTLSSKSQSLVAVDEIPADNSGRSFLIKIPGGQVVYFWCSEKSKLLGVELLVKMKDLLKRKPSIAELTGICESRLSCFATHLHAYLAATVGSSQASSPGSPIPPLDTTTELSDTSQSGHSLISFKSLRSWHIGIQSAEANSFHPGSLSPRTGSFKEGPPRNLSSLRSATRENLRRRGDGHLSSVENLTVTLSTAVEASSSNNSENDITRNLPFSPSSLLESLGKLAVAPASCLTTQVSCVGLPLFSPHYCHCTPGVSTLQFSAAPQQLPASSNESQSLPHLSSLGPVRMPSSLLNSTQPPSLGEASTVNFPAFQPDPLFQLPTQTSHQILPTFTPLMCDPIVHIPVIDVCSSGQGYLVSVGPAISTAIHPLHTKLVNPLMPETDSILEKGARETLRLLISGSSRTNLPLMGVFPAVLTKADQNQSMLVGGSQGLCSGTTDVGVIANSISAMSLGSLSERSDGDSSYDNTDIHPATSCGSVGSCSVDKGSTSCSDWMEESD